MPGTPTRKSKRKPAGEKTRKKQKPAKHAKMKSTGTLKVTIKRPKPKVEVKPESADEQPDYMDTTDAEKSPSMPRKGYRNYSLNDLLRAYKMVKEKNVPVQKAAQMCGVPVTTLRDRVHGKVDMGTLRPGPASLLSMEQEMTLVDHISYMAGIGYGYTRADIFKLATEMACHLGIIEKGRMLNRSWYRRFRKRWPLVCVVKSRDPPVKKTSESSLTDQETLQSYFDELSSLLEAHNIIDQPDRIYTVDDCFLAQEHKRCMMYSQKGNSSCITVIGSCNASGNALPPYFVFPEHPDSSLESTDAKVTKNALPGSLIRFRDTHDVWSDKDIFQDYITSHFIKDSDVGCTAQEPILLLFNREKRHISASIEWAKQHNVILFPLPPKTGYAYQIEDVGCLGHMKVFCEQECHKSLLIQPEKSVTKSDMCKYACSAYLKCMMSENLISFFRQTGTCPFNPEGIAKSRVASYYVTSYNTKSQSAAESLSKLLVSKYLTAGASDRAITAQAKSALKRKRGRPAATATASKRQRKPKILKDFDTETESDSDHDMDMTNIPVASTSFVATTADHTTYSSRRPPRTVSESYMQGVQEPSDEYVESLKTEPLEETSDAAVEEEEIAVAREEEEEEEDDDGEVKCLVCRKATPQGLFDTSMVSWLQCDSCQGWCHLLCSDFNGDSDCPFLCPGCTDEFKLYCDDFTAGNITEWLKAKRAIAEILTAHAE